MERRIDHTREEIRELALSAAEALLDDEGSGAMTARRNAQGIGYTVDTLYLIFDNLDDLTLHVNGRTLGYLHHCAQEATQDADSPRSEILRVGRVYAQYSLSRRAKWRHLFRPRQDPDIQFPSWYLEKVEQLFSLIERPLLALGSDARDAHVGARALWSAVHGICTLNDSDILHIGLQPSAPERLTLNELVVRTSSSNAFFIPNRTRSPLRGSNQTGTSSNPLRADRIPPNTHWRQRCV
jgi:AcrR family transcriptional regulator